MSSKRALLCSYYMPQTNLDSAARRSFHLVEFLRQADWEVTVVAQNATGVERYKKVLQQRGVAVYTSSNTKIDELLREGRFDLAILGFWHIAEPLIPLIRTLSSTTRIIVDSFDIHFLRHARRILRKLADNPAAGMLDTHYASDMIREVNAYAAADAVLTVSQKEADLITDFVGDPSLAHAIPDCEDLAPSMVPFAERKGMVLLGNFQHPPNIEAVQYLCQEILPKIDPTIRVEHPVYVIGNELTENVRSYGRGLEHVHMVGWVPSVLPYLERARISLVPLLHGAGTKRKLIQTLTIGTPAVSTSVGVEGLNLRHQEHLLIADDPQSFANAMATLLYDVEMWHRLARNGRHHITNQQGREVTRARFMDVVSRVLSTQPKRVFLPDYSKIQQHSRLAHTEYQRLIKRLQNAVERALPLNAKVIVISKGDEDLLKLNGRPAWHFPQNDQGVYAGHYPANSKEAIEHLEALRAKGGDFLVLPSTAFWWLEHYGEFKQHLESHYHVVLREEKTCVIFDLRQPAVNVPDQAENDVPSLGPEPSSVSEQGSITKHVMINARSPDSTHLPRVSVIIPTFNRARLLASSLESLTSQSVTPGQFEVVVVDDGSTDETSDVCRRFSSRLALKYIRTAHTGIAAAKNAGIATATGAILLFFDDDDIANQDLVREHLKTHHEHPEENVAVLGFTTWAPSLQVTEVMNFVTNIGHYLFGYHNLTDGQPLDFTYFWGGRSSCKRLFLLKHGVFNEQFEFGSEDIELGYRLSKHALKVVFNWTSAH